MLPKKCAVEKIKKTEALATSVGLFAVLFNLVCMSLADLSMLVNAFQFTFLSVA